PLRFRVRTQAGDSPPGVLVLASGRSQLDDLSGSGGRGCLGRAVLPKLFHASSGRGTIKSENCNPTTLEPGTRRRLVLLQTLTTQDFDEQAHALPRWDLRFRQLGPAP